MSPHFVSFARRYHASMQLVSCLPSPLHAKRRTWSWSSGISSRTFLTWKRQGLPSSWGTPISICTCSSTPVGRQSADQNAVVARLPLKRKRKLQREFLFRGSIAWLLDSLSTLRSAGYPNTTQDSLPALVRLCRVRSTHWAPAKGFSSRCHETIPPSQALLGATFF